MARGSMRTYAEIKDVDRGYKRLAQDLGGVAEIDLGVFGQKAAKQHTDSDLSLGTLAAMIELGLGGQIPRSFIRAWMDRNERMMTDDAIRALQSVILGVSRKTASEAIAKKWAKGIRHFILSGQARPHNTASTVARKGHDVPVLGLTGELADAVSYKVKLPTTKTMRAVVRTAAERALSAMLDFTP